MAAVLKTANPQGFVGSNPTPSATNVSTNRAQPPPKLGRRLVEDGASIAAWLQHSPSDIEETQSAPMRTGRVPRTAKIARVVLAGALSDAVRDRLVPHNVAKLARPLRVQRPGLRLLSWSQARELLEAR